MSYYEAQGIDDVFGLTKNGLLKKIDKALKKSRRQFAKTHHASRRDIEFHYHTVKTWSKTRRVVGKAEYLYKRAKNTGIRSSQS